MEWSTKSNAFYRSRKIAPATWVLLIDFEREREGENQTGKRVLQAEEVFRYKHIKNANLISQYKTCEFSG